MSALRRLLVLTSLATTGVALWLFLVIVGVLPHHDAAHIPFWRAVALGFVAYSGLCAVWLSMGATQPWLRWNVFALSLMATALGAFGIAIELRRANAGGDFEGYIVLMGAILVIHGLAGAACTLFAYGPRTSSSRARTGEPHRE